MDDLHATPWRRDDDVPTPTPPAGESRLGPPGWSDYSDARGRFFSTLAVAGLERAWSMPSHSPPRGRLT
jgi:hypothetical protein